MTTKVTVVYEMELEEDAQHLLEAFKTRQVMKGTGSIVACCQGDAMEHRDAYKWALELEGIDTEDTLKSYQECNKKQEPNGS